MQKTMLNARSKNLNGAIDPDDLDEISQIATSPVPLGMGLFIYQDDFVGSMIGMAH